MLDHKAVDGSYPAAIVRRPPQEAWLISEGFWLQIWVIRWVERKALTLAD